MNVLCFGGRTTGISVAWNLVASFLEAKFSGAERHRRRLAKVAQLEEGMMTLNEELSETKDRRLQ